MALAEIAQLLGVGAPKHFQEAQRKGLRGQALLQRVDKSERQLIERFRKAGVVDGLIGRQA